MKTLWAHVDPLISSENDSQVIPLGSMWDGVSLNKPDWVEGDMKRGRVKTQSDVQANRASVQDLLYLWASHLGRGYPWTRQADENQTVPVTVVQEDKSVLMSPHPDLPHVRQASPFSEDVTFTLLHCPSLDKGSKMDKNGQGETAGKRFFLRLLILLSLPDSMPSR